VFRTALLFVRSAVRLVYAELPGPVAVCSPKRALCELGDRVLGGDRIVEPRRVQRAPRQGIRSWPSTSGRHDCAAPCRTQTRAPACTPRTAPTTRRSAPGAARRTRHRRRRSRTPGPPATPTRPRGPHSSSARESSLPAGPAPRLQNPQPMSELRNHPRKLTPNSATFTRTGHPLYPVVPTSFRAHQSPHTSCTQVTVW
jgi:hypothetical protein